MLHKLTSFTDTMLMVFFPGVNYEYAQACDNAHALTQSYAPTRELTLCVCVCVTVIWSRPLPYLSYSGSDIFKNILFVVHIIFWSLPEQPVLFICLVTPIFARSVSLTDGPLMIYRSFFNNSPCDHVPRYSFSRLLFLLDLSYTLLLPP